jgi:plasmid stability protein
MLSYCDVRTIYLRNVPDDVVDKLEQMAARAGMSLNAFSVRELGEVARRADNAALLEALPSLDVAVADIIRGLDDSRATR